MEVERLQGFFLFSEKMQLTSLSPPPPPPPLPSDAAGSSFFSDGVDDMWDYFPCPFCYVEIEVPALCTHLQEHCFDVKNAVCPICAANPGKDIIEHMTVQHSYLLKHRRSQKTNLRTNSSLEHVAKESYESNVFVGAGAQKRGNKLAPDPKLSFFIADLSFEECKNNQEMSFSVPAGGDSSLCMNSRQSPISNTVSDSGQDYETRSLVASFIQQMLLSTIF